MMTERTSKPGITWISWSVTMSLVNQFTYRGLKHWSQRLSLSDWNNANANGFALKTSSPLETALFTMLNFRQLPDDWAISLWTLRRNDLFSRLCRRSYTRSAILEFSAMFESLPKVSSHRRDYKLKSNLFLSANASPEWRQYCIKSFFAIGKGCPAPSYE